MSELVTPRPGRMPLTEAFILAYQGRLYRYCHRLTGDADRAWDLLQDTWARVVRSGLPAEAPAAGWFPWLALVARNASIDLRSRTRPTVSLSAGLAPCTDTDDPARQVEHTDLLERLHELILRLPADEMAVLLRLFEERSLAEVAAQQNISVSTAKRLRRRALSRLRDRLAGTG